jgi:hypothetical protein
VSPPFGLYRWARPRPGGVQSKPIRRVHRARWVNRAACSASGRLEVGARWPLLAASSPPRRRVPTRSVPRNGSGSADFSICLNEISMRSVVDWAASVIGSGSGLQTAAQIATHRHNRVSGNSRRNGSFSLSRIYETKRCLASRSSGTGLASTAQVHSVSGARELLLFR